MRSTYFITVQIKAAFLKFSCRFGGVLIASNCNNASQLAPLAEIYPVRRRGVLLCGTVYQLLLLYGLINYGVAVVKHGTRKCCHNSMPQRWNCLPAYKIFIIRLPHCLGKRVFYPWSTRWVLFWYVSIRRGSRWIGMVELGWWIRIRTQFCKIFVVNNGFGVAVSAERCLQV